MNTEQTFKVGDRVRIVMALAVDRDSLEDTVGVMATVVPSDFDGMVQIKLDRCVEGLGCGEYPDDYYAWASDDPEIAECLTLA